ncbi:hypothetical protein C8Q80DRAFT_772456 [Daedaleopsis nitida]|nr:hypothetical protein C8Q80DRAFT_772456 [Daedaleopsis nitida]
MSTTPSSSPKLSSRSSKRAPMRRILRISSALESKAKDFHVSIHHLFASYQARTQHGRTSSGGLGSEAVRRSPSHRLCTSRPDNPVSSSSAGGCDAYDFPLQELPSGPHATYPVCVCLEGIHKIVASLTPENSAQFLDCKGEHGPW